ncbi:TPA: single-stranded-DNA-specific exonuclease RecJ [Candidatus Uhrbacteria bacterium]|nr:single-stranded-DNA-specific exonuclease RecJ [Candidatus Uhrbacteria bacterium]
MSKAWVIQPKVSDDVVRQLLLSRNIPEAEHEAFLSPDWEKGTHSPWLFSDMPLAVDRVFAALEEGEKIVIHGDYDADGVCGSTLLFGALTDIWGKLTPRPSLGQASYNISVFLPDREKDGYGVAMHTIERLAAEGVQLLITVDCGIANADQLDRAAELGMDVIVCDHHQLGERLPEAAMILHPLAPGEEYPNKMLCGTGVAFKLASALCDEARKRGLAVPVGYEKWWLDLVAIATVTDVMPLVGENRVLEYFGLTVLRKTRRPGLLAILTSAGVDLESVDTETIGFRIGPRLNAAGRLASASLAFSTLAATDQATAQKAAAELEILNSERQNISATSYKQAAEIVDDKAAVLVVYHEDWLPGIVGLVAGRLVNDYGKPAFAFAKAGEHYVGSGRSVAGLHLVEAMNSCGDIYLKKGGHPQACGLSLASLENLELFRERVGSFADKFFGGVEPVQSLLIEAELPLETASMALLTDLNRCAPFGEGNRAPVFAARGLPVVVAEIMGGSGAHLRLTVQDGAKQRKKLVGFGFGSWLSALPAGTLVDVAYTLEVNEWNGRRELQCRIVDLKLTENVD